MPSDGQKSSCSTFSKDKAFRHLFMVNILLENADTGRQSDEICKLVYILDIPERRNVLCVL